MSDQIIFIINPVSGVMEKDNIIDIIDQEFHNINYKIHFTESTGHAAAICREETDANTFIAVGGDGTINEIAGVIKDTDKVLGIIPSGSGNGLARHLHIPMGIKKAVRLIKERNVKKIDTASINDHTFVSMAGVGFDGLIASKFSKCKRRGFIAYLKIVTEQYPKYKPGKYTLHFDDHEEKVEALFITFNNSDQFGYNAAIAPHASASDGLLDICIAQKPP
jgi:YegS/Rv2252/BmrU family lipid kinase